MQILLYLIIYIKRGFTLGQRLFLASPQLLKHHLIHQSLVLAKKILFEPLLKYEQLNLKNYDEADNVRFSSA